MIEFCGLPLTIKKNPRAKRVLVKLVPGRGLEVVVPKRLSTTIVPEILDEKRAWIERTRDKMIANGTDLSGQLPDLPEIIEFRAADREYQIDYLDHPGRVKVTENATRLLVRGPMDDSAGIIEALRKFTTNRARETMLPLLNDLSHRIRMPYSALRIRNQKTRWGSCSARGTISLNAKLLFLPIELVNHLLLHELCHTRQLNHSEKYWALVANYEPDFARLEDALKRGGKYVPQWFA